MNIISVAFYFNTQTMYVVGLVGFYDISSIVGFLMPNPVFIYIKGFVNICGRYIFKQVWAHSFVQLNGFKYFYQTQIFLFTVCHLFAHS